MSKKLKDEARAASEPPKRKVLAVVDIGGSSITLEFRWQDQPFEKDEKNLPLKLKRFCRLSQSISKTGKICEEGRVCALETLREVNQQISALKKQGYEVQVKAIGTAPFRDASNGKAVAQKLIKKSGIDLKVISGEEEARLVALGALAVLGDEAKNFSGIIIDTGGGSSEFALIENGEIKDVASLPLGNLRIKTLEDTKAQQAFISQHLATLPESFRRHDLPVVLSGGGNRALIRAFKKAYRDLALHPAWLQSASMKEIFDYSQSLGFAAKFNNVTPAKLAEALGIKEERIEILSEISLLIGHLRSELGYQQVRLLKSTTRDGLRAQTLMKISDALPAQRPSASESVPVAA